MIDNTQNCSILIPSALQLEDVDQFTGSSQHEDDMTLVVVKAT